MTNRKLAYIVKDQKPVMLRLDDTVRRACQVMSERRAGSALVIGEDRRLRGIFTARDAVGALASGRDGETTRLAEVMTPEPLTLGPESRAIDAIKIMVEGGFRHVPIIEDGTILGVVSRGNFAGMEFEEFNWPAYYASTGSTANRQIGTIVEGQTPLVLTVDDTVRRACQNMSQHGSGSVLVVDKQGHLSGIFTGRDAVNLFAQVKDAAGTRLRIAMKPNPMTISPQAYAIDALRVMSDGGFRHLPVVNDGRIYGVISRNDFTGVEVDRLDDEQNLAECIW